MTTSEECSTITQAFGRCRYVIKNCNRDRTELAQRRHCKINFLSKLTPAAEWLFTCLYLCLFSNLECYLTLALSCGTPLIPPSQPAARRLPWHIPCQVTVTIPFGPPILQCNMIDTHTPLCGANNECSAENWTHDLTTAKYRTTVSHVWCVDPFIWSFLRVSLV